MLAYCGLIPMNYLLSFWKWSNFKETTNLKIGRQLFYGDCLQLVVAGNICKSLLDKAQILKISV